MTFEARRNDKHIHVKQEIVGQKIIGSTERHGECNTFLLNESMNTEATNNINLDSF